ncbi:MAG: efflux RND transporter periplasmic adaptor subunit [Leptolyngbyaceae cyanobacterium MO_188.B28]|nr:efflux RND transporter periplasmic adaptor subunit [Leptolyngbyaceae cyanobacterium MO_188.B28]
MAIHLPLIGKIRRTTPLAVSVLAIGLIGVGAGVYWTTRDRVNAADIGELTLPVKTQALTIRIEASGVVEPIQTVNLSPRTSDILAELYVEQGDQVSQGQVIARMKGDDIEAELTQARARVAQAKARLTRLRNGNRAEDISQSQARVTQAEARLADAEARLALAAERVERNRFLTGQGALSRDELDAAIREVESARADLELDRASLTEAQHNLSLLQRGNRVEDITEAEANLQEMIGLLQAVEVRLEDTYIRAPFDGVINQKFATEGAFVTPTTSASDASSASSSAIVEIARGLEVVAEVPEVDIGEISVGQRVDIVADAYPDKIFEGRVRLVAPEAILQQNVTLFQIRVELTTGDDLLKSGMNVDVEFIAEQSRETIVVPTVVIVTRNGEPGVLTLDDNQKAQFRPVTLGSVMGDQMEILDGIEAGERILINLPPGQTLQDLNKS